MAVRIALFFAAYFAIIGIVLPYLPVWLADARGFGAEAIGWIMAAVMWARVATLPIGQIADRAGERKRPILVLNVLATSFLACFALVSGFWPVLLLCALWSVASSGVMPLADVLALQEGRRLGLDYGRMRLWGSLAFIATAFGLGGLIDRAEAWIILPSLIAASIILTGAGLLLPDVRVERRPGEGGIRELLHQPAFLGVILAAGLIQASHGVYYAFGTLHWQAAGLSGGLIGWLWAEGVIAETILFAFSGAVVGRIGPLRLLWIAAALTTLRWLGTSLTTAPAALLVLQVLHGASFGATHLAAMFYLRDALPPHLHASGQAALATSIWLLMGGLSPLAGFVYAWAGGGAYLFAAAIALLGFVVALRITAPTGDRRVLPGS